MPSAKIETELQKLNLRAYGGTIEDVRNWALPGDTCLALGLPDEGPFMENIVKSHVVSFYTDFKDELVTQISPFVQKLLGFKDHWCLAVAMCRS